MSLVPSIVPKSPIGRVFFWGFESLLLLSNLYLPVAWLAGVEGNYQFVALWLWLAPWYLLHRGYWCFFHTAEVVAIFKRESLLDTDDPIEMLRSWSKSREKRPWMTQGTVRYYAVGVMALSVLAFFAQGNLYVMIDYTYRGRDDYKFYDIAYYYNFFQPKKANIGRRKDNREYPDVLVLYRKRMRPPPEPQDIDWSAPIKPPDRLFSP